MKYKSGDFLELEDGRALRLNKDTAEIANAAVKAAEWKAELPAEYLEADPLGAERAARSLD